MNRPTARSRWWPPVLVAAVTLAVFARLVGCSFTDWDDPGTIANNRRLRPPSAVNVAFYWQAIGERTPGQLYTPVTYTVWSAAAALFGMRPGPFHGLNVALHAAAAVAAYDLLRRLVGRPWAAAAGALVFAVHPVQVESVGWASGTKDVLCGLFSVAALSAYVAAVGAPGRWPARWRYGLATGLFALAMLSKPTALVVPLMAVAIDRLVLGRPWPTVVRWLWPWAVLMVPCALWTRAAQPAPWASPVPGWTRPLVAADAIAFDIVKVAWPARLGVDYGRRPGTVVGSGAVHWTWLLPAAVAGLVVWRGRQAAAAGALFVLPVVPVSGVVPFDFQFYSTVADHYLYLPMVGVALGVALVVGKVAAKPPTPVCTLVVVVLGARAVMSEPVWQDTASLFRNGLAVNPRSFVSCGWLGYVEASAARQRAGGRYTVPPSDPAYRAWRSDLEQALGWYRAALDRLPDYVPALDQIATTAAKLGRPAEQRAALRQIVDAQPKMPPAMRAEPAELVGRLMAAGDPRTAVRYLDGLLRDRPGDPQLLMLRGGAMAAAAGGR